MGDGDGGQGLEVELEQLLKVTLFISQAWTLVKTNSITLPVPTKPRTKQGKNSMMAPMLCH